MQILVLGMHRSGTSVVSRLLNMMGAYFAPEGVEMPAHHSNPKGFWERKDVYELCKKLLASVGCDWQRLSRFNIHSLPAEAITEFKAEATRIILGMDSHRPWFLKEPRICLLAPLWLELLELPVCVFVHRSPLEVARSLETRNGFTGTFSFALWERYTTAALNATYGHRRIQVNHADLISHPVRTVRQLARELKAHGVRGLRTPSAEEILAFIDPSLYRAREEETGGLGRLSSSQRKLRNALEEGKALLETKPIRFSTASQKVLSRHDQAAEAEEKKATVAEWKSKTEQTEAALAQSRKDLETIRAQVAAQQQQLAERERLLKAAKEETIKNAAVSKEIREALRQEMALLRQEAKADATNAELVKRAQEIAKSKERNISLEKGKAALADEFSKLKGRLEQSEKAFIGLEKNNAALADDLGKFKGEWERSEKASTQLREELEAARQQLATQQIEIAAQRNEIAVQQEEIADRQRELKAAVKSAAARSNEISQIRTKLETLRNLTNHVKTANARVASLNLAVEDQSKSVREKDLQIEELTERSRILKHGLDTIEEYFSRLRASRSFQFMVYTARRMGLVSRTPRRCVEAITNQFPAIRKAVKMTKARRHDAGLELQRVEEKKTVRQYDKAQPDKDVLSTHAPANASTAGSEKRSTAGSEKRVPPEQPAYRFRITILSPTTNIHGGTKRLLTIAQVLHLRGHHVTFVRHFASRELDWFKLDAPLREIRFDEHSSLSVIEKQLPDADILLTYGNNRTAFLLNGLSRRKGLKYLLFMHLGVHDRALDEANTALPGFQKLATTTWVAEQLASLGAKSSVIGFGIHSDQFFPIEAFRDFRVGTLLHKEEWKRSADVIEAFKIVKKQIPQAQFVAFGQIKNPQIEIDCEYYFDPDQNQLREIYCSCAAWVTSSLWEGIGMCSVEAMLCKTPLITTDTGGSRDFCHAGNCILVEKKSPSAIAAGILRLLTDPEHGRRLAKRAYADIQEMSWEKCIGRLEHLFLSDAQRENPTVIAQRRCELTIGIPIHNQPDYVQACLRSIYENTAADFELILIDDHSDAQTHTLLRQAAQADPERVRYIRHETQKGFPYNCNRIISNSCGRYICLLNSDTIVTRHWDRHLIEALKTRPGLAITGPSTSYGVAKNHDRIAQQLDDVHVRRFDMNYEEIQSFAATLEKREAGNIEETEYLNGFCMMFNSEIIPTIGFFDEKFGLGSREEVEFIDRVRMAGYACGWVKYAYVHHYGNRSFDSLGESSKQLWEKNKQLYLTTKNQQKRVLVTEKRIAFLYASKFASSTRKRTFEIARKLQRYLNVETFHLPKTSEDVFRDFDIFIFQRVGGLNEKISPEILGQTMQRIDQYRPEGKLFLYDIDDFVFDAQGGIPRRLMQHCDGVIASTPHLQKLAESLNPRCLYLKNSIDYDRFLAAPPAKLGDAGFHILCASLGAVGQTALNEIAAKVKSRHPDTEVHLFCDSSYGATQQNLTLHSTVNLDELFGYMKTADIVVNFDLPDAVYRQQLQQQYGILPSQMEDFVNAKSGLKYYNAAAAAKPFVTTPQPSCYAQMIRHGVNGFLAESIDDFVDIILKLRSDAALRETIGQRAFEDVLANYTLDQTLFDYLRAFCEVLLERPSSASLESRQGIASHRIQDVAEIIPCQTN